MTSGYRKIPPEDKMEILKRIKVDGIAAARAAIEGGVSPKTVYGWLGKETHKSGVSWPEYNRLKRENQQLKEIVGHLTLDLRRTKKI